MNASWFSEYKGEVETLEFDHKINYLGIHIDNKNVQWDVHAIVGTGKKPYICARKIDNSNSAYYSTGTDSNQSGHHKWLPYYYKVVK